MIVAAWYRCGRWPAVPSVWAMFISAHDSGVVLLKLVFALLLGVVRPG